MLKIIVLDAFGIKAAPPGCAAALADDAPIGTKVFPDMNRGVPIMDSGGHVIGDRDYTGA